MQTRIERPIHHTKEPVSEWDHLTYPCSMTRVHACLASAALLHLGFRHEAPAPSLEPAANEQKEGDPRERDDAQGVQPTLSSDVPEPDRSSPSADLGAELAKTPGPQAAADRWMGRRRECEGLAMKEA